MMNELEALKLLATLSGKSFDDMLSAAESSGHATMDVKLRFQSMYTKDYLTGAFQFGVPVNITIKGLERLEQLEQEAIDKAKQEKQQSFQNKVSVAAVLVPLITFILGVVIEHYAGLISLVGKIFG